MIGAICPHYQHTTAASDGRATWVPGFEMPNLSYEYLDKVIEDCMYDRRNKYDVAEETDTDVETIDKVLAAYEAYRKKHRI